MTRPTPHLDSVKVERDEALADLKAVRAQLAEAGAALRAARRVNEFYAQQNHDLKHELRLLRAELEVLRTTTSTEE